MAARITAAAALLLPLLSRSAGTANRRHCLAFSSGAPSWRLPSASAFSAQARRGFSFEEDDFASPDDLRFEPPLKIVEYPDPVLRARNKRVNTFDENLKRLADEMFDVMYKTDGIGLSAPQVGINVQLMVFNPAGEHGEGQEIVLVNPIVYKASKKTLPFNEGCLSFPGTYADVERPASIKVDARDITGGRFRGVLFFDRMTEGVLESIRSQLKALEMKYEKRTGLQSSESIDKFNEKNLIAGFARK